MRRARTRVRDLLAENAKLYEDVNKLRWYLAETTWMLDECEDHWVDANRRAIHLEAQLAARGAGKDA